MSLITAHKILIASAIAFFAFYAGWEVRNYFRTDEAWALLRATAAAAASTGFGFYYRTIR